MSSIICLQHIPLSTVYHIFIAKHPIKQKFAIVIFDFRTNYIDVQDFQGHLSRYFKYLDTNH